MTSMTVPEKVPLTRVFLSSSGDVAEDRNLARQVLGDLPRDPLLDGRMALVVVNWDDPACRFLTVVGASGIGKSLLVDAGWSDTLGGARQIR